MWFDIQGGSRDVGVGLWAEFQFRGRSTELELVVEWGGLPEFVGLIYCCFCFWVVVVRKRIIMMKSCAGTTVTDWTQANVSVDRKGGIVQCKTSECHGRAQIMIELIRDRYYVIGSVLSNRQKGLTSLGTWISILRRTPSFVHEKPGVWVSLPCFEVGGCVF